MYANQVAPALLKFVELQNTGADTLNLSGVKVKICGVLQYANIVGVAIGYTIAASISMLAIKRANCFHGKGHANPCKVSSVPYMIIFGVAQVFFSQIPDFDHISWLSMLAAAMSFTYSSIGLGLGIFQVIGTYCTNTLNHERLNDDDQCTD